VKNWLQLIFCFPAMILDESVYRNLSCELTAVVATMKADGEVKHASAHKISVGTMTDFNTPLTVSDASLSDLSDADRATSVAKRMVTVLPGSSSIVSKLSPYLIALRPWSFTASLGPVALGTCLAFKSLAVFNLWIYIATNICALSVHAAGNLVNTYVDFTRVSFIFFKSVYSLSHSSGHCELLWCFCDLF